MAVGILNEAGITFPAGDSDLDEYEGMPVGFTEEGFPFRGDPDAPITLIEFSDYLCPFCGRHFNQTLPVLIDDYGESGQVNFVFRDFPLTSLHPTAPVGHAAALCVAEQGAALYWQMHDQLFANQNQWSGLRDPGEYLASVAEGLGVDMEAYQECMADGRTSVLVNDSVGQAQALGFGGTPTFQVVAKEIGQIYPLVGAQPLPVFTDMFDALLEGEQLPGGDSAVAEASLLDEDARVGASKVTFDFDDDLEIYNGLPAGFTEEGFPFLGNPEAAITLVEFSDYLCPFCGRHFNQTYPVLIENYGASGEVNFVFRDFPLASLHPTAHIGHEAANCVGQQSAALYWAMHDQLFVNQNQWANLLDPTEFVAALAESVGIDSEGFAECLAADETGSLVQDRVAEGESLGFNSTPTFQVLDNEVGEIHLVSGAYPYDVFSELFDALIAGEEPPDPDQQEPAELPFWANEQGLAADPDRPGYTMAGDPYKGDPSSPLVVVEFSDFQCPACQRHALENQELLDEQLVETGDVMWVFKPLPLPEHQQALRAAAAAECAGEQGRFWEMHHELFANMERWASDEADGVIQELADELDLDSGAFAACYNGREVLERVVRDLYDARAVVQSTPTFVVIHGGRGALYNGYRPADNFMEILKNELAQAKAGN